MRTLHGIHYSPWTQRARWALDHHQLAYRFVPYAPLVGEPGLRARLRRPFGRVSVPVLFEEGQVIDDSVDIARHADAVGGAPALFTDECPRWVALADRALSAGRARTAETVLRDPDAQRDAVAFLAPPALRGALRPVARFGARHLVRKYGAEPAAALEDVLEALRAGLGGRAHLTGERLSFGDIAMAGALEFVSPGAHVKRSEAERRAWTDARLAKRYADLLAWRDELIGAHWPKR